MNENIRSSLDRTPVSDPEVLKGAIIQVLGGREGGGWLVTMRLREEVEEVLGNPVDFFAFYSLLDSLMDEPVEGRDGTVLEHYMRPMEHREHSARELLVQIALLPTN